jgi:hypothetical protein
MTVTVALSDSACAGLRPLLFGKIIVPFQGQEWKR